jgi:hypothetical protein
LGFFPCHDRLVKATKLNKGHPNATPALSIAAIPTGNDEAQSRTVVAMAAQQGV